MNAPLITEQEAADIAAGSSYTDEVTFQRGGRLFTLRYAAMALYVGSRSSALPTALIVSILLVALVCEAGTCAPGATHSLRCAALHGTGTVRMRCAANASALVPTG